jgi:peroxiredoxin
MIKPAFITLLSLWALALTPGVIAQVAGMTPPKPQAGDVLTIAYNPKAPGAKLTLDEDVYAIGQIHFPERKSVVFKMRKVGEVYQHEFKVPADLSYISFSFRSVNARDPEVKVETLIYRADDKPVRNAYLSKLISERTRWERYKDLSKQELDLYPDNYAVYVPRWEYVRQPTRLTGQSIEDILDVNKDWEVIERQAKEHNAEYQYARAMYSSGMMKLDEFVAALKQMLRDHAASPLTWSALEIFLYRAKMKRDTSEEVKAIERAHWELIQRYPDSQMARDSLQSFAWSNDFFNPKNEFPLAGLEQIADRWIVAEPDNPFPRTYLARIYHDRQQKSERALALIEEALALYVSGKYQLFMNSEKIYASENLLADGFLLSARLHLRLQKLTEAYVRVKAARMQYHESPFRQTEFKSYELEARILRAQGNLMAAVGPYFTAWMNGSEEAEAGLKEVYQKRKGTLDGFTAYLRGKRDELASKETAPAFSVISLDGQKLDLAALKGKVVVLKFWSIACPPGKAEMDGLNSLVSEFKDKEVVFIAFATDQENELREFLKTKAFNYQIIPNAETIHQKYNINLWPTHIILNREGKIAQRITSGGMNRHDELRRLINLALY